MASSGGEPSTSYSNTEDARTRKPRLTEKQKLKQWFDGLTYEEQCLWQQKAAYELLKDQYTEYEGENWSLWDLGVARDFQVLREETGLGQDTQQDAREAINRRPGWMLRQGAPKMNLRPDEADALGLSLMGRGNKTNFTPLHDIPVLNKLFPPSRDFAYGIFCRPEIAQRLFTKRYGKLDPHEVLASPEFYQDLVLSAPRIELTSMIVVARDLPVDVIAREYMPLLREYSDNGIELSRTVDDEVTTGVVPCGAFDKNEVNRFGDMFTPAALQGLPIASPDGKKLLDGTKIFLTSKPTGGLAVEAESPGTLAEQRHLLLGEFRSRALTYAVFDTLMGKKAIDPVARVDIGACFLYFANGFTLKDNPANPHQTRWDDPLKGQEVEVLDASPELFVLPPLGASSGKASNLLVGGIRKRAEIRERLRRDRAGSASGSPSPAVQ